MDIGEITPGPELAKIWMVQAADGDKAAQNNLASCYKFASGVPKDLNEAFRLYKLSAEQGFAAAQNSLGVAYKFGDGVAPNQKLAAKWQVNFYISIFSWNFNFHPISRFERAAKQGDANGQGNFGQCLRDGHGVKSDLRKATEYFRKSADQVSETQNSPLRSPNLILCGAGKCRGSV